MPQCPIAGDSTGNDVNASFEAEAYISMVCVEAYFFGSCISLTDLQNARNPV